MHSSFITGRKRDHVKCEVRAAGVNPVDSKFVFGDKLPDAMRGVVQRMVHGFTPGFDFSGVVVETPPGSPRPNTGVVSVTF